MAFNNSKAARNRRAQQDLAVKLALEAGLASSLRVFFRKLSSDFRIAYSSSGSIINTNVYLDELVDILRPHYRKVSSKFARSLRANIKSHFMLSMEYKQDDQEVDGEIRNFVNTVPLIQAGFIIASTQNIIDDIVGSVIAAQLSLGKALSNKEIADKSYVELNKRNTVRATTIATTETQKAAEGTKFLEANTLINTGAEVNGLQVSKMTTKEWNAVLDTHTRSFHAVADGQRKPVDEPYSVDNELLMYPGDTSLGASLYNVINCRCGSQFVIDTNTLTAEQVDLRPRDFSVAGSPLIVRSFEPEQKSCQCCKNYY